MDFLRIKKVFGVPEDYNLEQLKSSYINIVEKLSKSDKTQIEKELLFEQYKKLYQEGKELYYLKNNNTNNQFNPYQQIIKMNNYFNQLESKIFSEFNNFNNFNKNMKTNMYSSSKSYSSKLNPDGSISVIESKSESSNGKNNNVLKAYKKMPNGKIIPFTEEEMKKLNLKNEIKNKKYLIIKK